MKTSDLQLILDAARMHLAGQPGDRPLRAAIAAFELEEDEEDEEDGTWTARRSLNEPADVFTVERDPDDPNRIIAAMTPEAAELLRSLLEQS